MITPKVSIIVTTKNESKNIVRLLTSLKKQTYANIEIIIVDNNSTDDTKALAKSYGNVYNQGPERSAQRNFGARKATGTYLLFLDADMELTPNVVASCVQTIENHLAIIIPEKSIGIYYWERVKVLERDCYIGDPDMELPRFYRKDTFMTVNGFDEEITGPEIEDLYNRAIQHGTVGRVNEHILHYEQVSKLWDIIKKKYYYCKSLHYYLHKGHPMARRQFKLLRPAYIRNWKAFLKQPHITLGFLVMRTGEGCAALLGMLYKK